MAPNVQWFTNPEQCEGLGRAKRSFLVAVIRCCGIQKFTIQERTLSPFHMFYLELISLKSLPYLPRKQDVDFSAIPSNFLHNSSGTLFILTNSRTIGLEGPAFMNFRQSVDHSRSGTVRILRWYTFESHIAAYLRRVKKALTIR